MYLSGGTVNGMEGRIYAGVECTLRRFDEQALWPNELGPLRHGAEQNEKQAL